MALNNILMENTISFQCPSQRRPHKPIRVPNPQVLGFLFFLEIWIAEFQLCHFQQRCASASRKSSLSTGVYNDIAQDPLYEQMDDWCKIVRLTTDPGHFKSF